MCACFRLSSVKSSRDREQPDRTESMAGVVVPPFGRGGAGTSTEAVPSSNLAGPRQIELSGLLILASVYSSPHGDLRLVDSMRPTAHSPHSSPSPVTSPTLGKGAKERIGLPSKAV